MVYKEREYDRCPFYNDPCDVEGCDGDYKEKGCHVYELS